MADRGALEGVHEEEEDTPDNDEADSGPQDAPNSGSREHSKIEKQERELADGNVDIVDSRPDVKVVKEVADLGRSEGPDVLSETIGNTSGTGETRKGSLDEGGEEDHPVVEAEEEIGGEDLDGEALDDEERRD